MKRIAILEQREKSIRKKCNSRSGPSHPIRLMRCFRKATREWGEIVQALPERVECWFSECTTRSSQSKYIGSSSWWIRITTVTKYIGKDL